MMAFTFYSPPKATAEESNPSAAAFRRALESYQQFAYKHPSMEEAIKQARLANQYYGPNIESQMALRGAQAGHLGALTQGQNITNQSLPEKLRQEAIRREFENNNPLLRQPGMIGQVGGLNYLKQHPELLQGFGSNQDGQQPMQQGSPGEQYVANLVGQPQQGMQQIDPLTQIYNAIINKGSKGKEFAPTNILKNLEALSIANKGINPSTMQSFANEDEKNSYIDALTENTTGLKRGEHYVYDPETHEKIGTQRPLTVKERDEEGGRVFFNEVLPQIQKGTYDFAGKGSIKRLDKYASEYSTNPEAREKIINLILADKLMASGTIKEAATLGGGRTNQTFNTLRKTLSSEDIPEIIKKYQLGTKIPQEAFNEAQNRFLSIINNATQKSAASVPAMRTNYFHPERYATQETALGNEINPADIQVLHGKRYKLENGNWKEIK